MGDGILGSAIFVLLILVITPFILDDAFAKDFNKHVTAEDLGILQLAAHDLFNVDRCNGDVNCSEDFENGKLDLSTLFKDTVNNYTPFENDIIELGGEPRNRENILIFTVASELGITYVKLLENGVDEIEAKNTVIGMYHEKLVEVYQKTFNEPFPKSQNGEVTHQENLALRTIHDFLPGKIKFDNKLVSILDPSLNGQKLDQKELQQKSSMLDGKFDAEFLEIETCFPPDFSICIDVNLLEADRTFGDQFELELSFDEFLDELKDGKYDEGDWVMFHIRNLMSKGQNF